MEKGDAVIEDFISRMHGVKKTGNNRWICKCPSHQDKTASLSVSQEEDGRILINCFAGCDTYSILRSAGMDWQDVMPESRLGEFKPKKTVIYASEGLKLLQHETRVLLLIAYDLKKGVVLDDTMERLEKAMDRVNRIIEGCGIE
jgi:hypothetical protein